MAREVVTAKSVAKKDGLKTVFEWLAVAALRRGVRLEKTICDAPVTARIDHGRWIADCECNGAEYVDPEEPIFFCLSCLNREHGGKLRPVKFPTAEVRKKILAGLNPANYYSWNEREEPYGI